MLGIDFKLIETFLKASEPNLKTTLNLCCDINFNFATRNKLANRSGC